MTIDPKELTRVPSTAPFSRIRYVSLLDEDQIAEFFQGLLRTTVEVKEEGNWDKLSQYIEEWEDRIGNTLFLGRQVYETGPWTPLTKPLSRCKVAIVTTGGVYVDEDKPFDVTGDWSFRILPKDTPHDSFHIAHAKYDLTGVLEDINTVFPVDTLRELESEGVIGTLAEANYGFMGFIPKPEGLISETAPEVARRLRADGVDAVIIPTTWPVCNRSGGLIARAIEEAGVPTVVINEDAKVPERLKTPRAVIVRFPYGRPMGEPGNKAQHRVIAEDALQMLATAKEPNTIVLLPYRWKRTDFVAILEERKANRGQ